MKRLLPLLTVMALALAAAACGGGENPAVNTTGTQSPQNRVTPTGGTNDQERAEAPSLTIDSPADGAAVSGSSVEVKITPSHFKVVDKLGKPAVKGEGHVHFYMDVKTIPTEPGKPAVTAEGTYHATATTSHTWTNVQPGDHTFAVQLVNNDHTPLSPPVFKTVKVTVTAG